MISDIVGRCLAACRAVLGSSKTCVLAFSLVCVSVAPASAQLERRFIRSGNKSYERADYDKASENYVKALDKNKESIEAIANMGNVLYKQDNFEAAGEIFSRLAESETDTLLKAGDYYNLGNNLFKQRRFEEALEAYKNALRLDPSDADAAYNLSVAEARTVNRIEGLPEFFVVSWFRNISHIMTSNGWAVVSILFFALMLAGGVWYLLASTVGQRKAGFTVSAVSLFLFVVAVCVATSQKRDKIDSGRAVVMATAAAVKSSPSVSGKDLFVLGEGVCVSLGEKIGDWRQITIASGDKGWILSEQIEVI